MKYLTFYNYIEKTLRPHLSILLKYLASCTFVCVGVCVCVFVIVYELS
jgi:hypothetical protein